MVNTQPIEKPSEAPLDGLDIINCWYTIQGEGPLAGTPAVFVRLAGCNLQCPACDTTYTGPTRKVRSFQTCLLDVQMIGPPGCLVVITGGEPFRQRIGLFVNKLIHAGHTVQIETNGTLFLPDLPYPDTRLLIVCSPKTPTLHPDLVPHISAYKYIVQKGHVFLGLATFSDLPDGLPLTTMGYDTKVARPPIDFPKSKIFIQPLDQEPGNEQNTKIAVNVCMAYGYRLSLQLHKQLGLE